jgi:hypothetical protein
MLQNNSTQDWKFYGVFCFGLDKYLPKTSVKGFVLVESGGANKAYGLVGGN